MYHIPLKGKLFGAEVNEENYCSYIPPIVSQSRNAKPTIGIKHDYIVDNTLLYNFRHCDEDWSSWWHSKRK